MAVHKGGGRKPAGYGDALLVALAAGLCLVAIAVPRFGGLGEPPSDAEIEHTTPEGRELAGLTVDSREYLRLTEYYSGDAPAPELAPFNYRLGTQWMAGLLPWDSPFALNIVVLSMLVVGLFAMVLAQVRWGSSLRGVIAAAALYAISFPVFYWGSFNYVDGAVVGALAVTMLLVALERPWLASVAVGLSMLLKEWALVGLLVVLAWTWFARSGSERLRISGFALACAIGGLAGARLVAPEVTEFYNPWIPSLSDIAGYVGWNTSQPGPIGQSLLTAVPLAVAGWVVLVRSKGALRIPVEVRAALMAGVGGSLLLAVWSFVAAQWDGRALWMAYPFALTALALAWTSNDDGTVPVNAASQGGSSRSDPRGEVESSAPASSPTTQHHSKGTVRHK